MSEAGQSDGGRQLSVLQLSGAPPFRAGDGSASTFATLQATCGAGHRVVYAYPWLPQDPPDADYVAELTELCEGRVSFFPIHGNDEISQKLTRWQRRASTLARLARAGLAWRVPRELRRGGTSMGRLLAILQTMSPSCVDGLQRLMAQHRFDVVQVDYPWLINVPRVLSTSLPMVFVAHEIQTTIVEQEAPSDSRLTKAVFEVESEALARFDCVITLSEEDAELLRSRFGLSNVVCSPLAVASSCVDQTTTDLTSDRPRFTFLGGYRHSPNEDAVRWLADEIVPALVERLPSSEVTIVGAYPDEFVSKFQSRHLRFAGFVNDVMAELRGSVFLCPIRIGSGIRIKILDAIQAGAPVISTQIGASGLGLEDGRNVLIAEDPMQFADQAASVLEQPSFRERLVSEAKSHVCARFSAHAVGRRRTEIFHELLVRPDRR